MQLFKNMLVLIALLSITACGDDKKDKKDTKETEEASCSKSGSMASFTITCTKPIESYHTGNVTMSPQKSKMTVNGVEVSFSADNKTITGKDAGSGKTSMSWDLTLEGGKKVTVKIP